MYKNYVSESLGLKEIGNIKYSDIKAFYNQLIRDKGFKPNSMEIINTILHPTFTLAVRDGYIRTNPTDGAMAEIKKSHDWKKPMQQDRTYTVIGCRCLLYSLEPVAAWVKLSGHFSVHNLRHTFCTRFCENETNIKVIQDIMGHADISTTMNIYAEATESKKKESFDNLEGKIKIS